MSRKTPVILLLLLLLALPCPPLLAAEAAAEHGEAGGLTELIFKWLNFLVVFGGGGYFAARPLRAWFAGQRQAIRGEISEAQRHREESRQRLAEMEQRLAGLEQEIEILRRQSAQDAIAERRRVQEAARRETERVLATAKAEIDSAGRAARLELRAYAARLAVSLAEQRLRERLTPQAHAALFDASLRQIAAPAARRPAGGAERT